VLRKFGAKNFFCFRDWIEIDLTLNSKVPPELRSLGDVSTILCLKGGNSSGKTNALKILSFLSSFATSSFNRKTDEKLMLETFFNNKNPTEFFIEFQIDDIQYTYELATTDITVISEKIYRKDKRKTLILGRQHTDITRNSLYDKKREVFLRDNASIISTAKQYRIEEIDSIYSFFDKVISNVDYFGHRHYFHDHAKLSEFYSSNPDVLDFVKEKICDFDTGVVDITIHHYEDDEKEKRYFPLFAHPNGNESALINYHFESSGTKSLYVYLAFYYLSIKKGGILVLDEFDTNLHPDILPRLLDIFEDRIVNSMRAQLIFSTHNSDILDRMGKYRTVLFNKEDGASYCYRLDELPPDILRNDRPIAPLYRSGRLGGVPKL
jgi:AAA15 family ATPase/GTPase